MTDTQPSTLNLDIMGLGPEYNGASIWMPQLFMEAQRAGIGNIENRTFVECLIEGPAVLLPLVGCDFDGCNFGDAHGDPRNLTLKPLGPERVTGVIPLLHCKFVRCQFLGIGFTGPQRFLDSLVGALGGAPS